MEHYCSVSLPVLARPKSVPNNWIVAEESAAAPGVQPFQVRDVRERSFFARVFGSRTSKAETAVENLIAERV